MKILVYHSYYGCECGCCGHRIEFYPDDDDRCHQKFEFGHAEQGQDLQAYGRELAEELIRYTRPDLLETIDWSTLGVEAVDSERCFL